ncbi:vWA domain-containing protein [Promethearchaeum syntrophicum]|uniref:VWA domain-containing protein n=1 Tax=Promethearchaeum syntrophicum TaxID=2594042 RepID=A0A5B9DF37_9ARCH|nr:vWA domain-containing protein [Candidatus Prometheoarchaeum syntrophicum]
MTETAETKRRYYRKKKSKSKKKTSRKKSKSNETKRNFDILKKKKIFTKEEKKILDIGKTAYNKALTHYFIPSLPDPDLIFDYSKTKGFFIDTFSWRVTLNLANTPFLHLDQEFLDYFFSLSLHEIAHYVYCPYDNLTNLRLLAAAIKGGVSKNHAPMIVNIFSDLLIDNRTHRKFKDLMNWELQITAEQALQESKRNKLSKLWKLLVRCYEILWDIEILPKTMISDELNKIAGKTCDIILKNYENESLWEKKVQKIAKILKDLLKEECKLANTTENMEGKNRSKNGDKQGNPFSIPNDVLETFGDISEVKNIDMIKGGDSGNKKSRGPNEISEIENAAEELAQEIDCKTFLDVLNLYGLGSLNEKLGIWYRSRAKNLLRFNYYESKPSGAIPLYPETWRIGDSLEELDPVQTLLASPSIIPNITTRKWSHQEGPSHRISKELPDMMIVIDSSGSMDWDFKRKKISGRYHISLLAAFAALHYAINNGSHVSAINFSNRVKKTTWTNNFYKIEQILLSYIGQGTVLPTKTMIQMAKSADRPSLIILISDLELYNWENALKTFKILMQRGHTLIAFFIDGDEELLEQEDFQELIARGAKFYCVHKMKDLIGLVISEVQEVYTNL